MPKDMRNEIGREEERKREMMQVMMSSFVLVTISKFQVSVDMFIYTKTKHKT